MKGQYAKIARMHARFINEKIVPIILKHKIEVLTI